MKSLIIGMCLFNVTVEEIRQAINACEPLGGLVSVRVVNTQHVAKCVKGDVVLSWRW